MINGKDPCQKQIPAPTRRGLLHGGACFGLTAVLTAPVRAAETAAPFSVLADRVGYLPQGRKWALLSVPAGADGALVHLKDASGAIAARLAPQGLSEKTVQGTAYARLDFSTVTTPGSYVFELNGRQSAPVIISDGLWQAPLDLILRGLYLQRCGVALNDPESGLRHRPCHTEDGAGQGAPAGGGWHDGASYAKSLSATALVTGLLLSVYEDHPDPFTDGQMRFPETGNGRPDLLDEMIVGLDWIAAMQRPDGAIRAGIGSDAAPRAVMPHNDLAPRTLLPATLADTARGCAALAQGARIYQAVNTQKAVLYRQAALRAWQALDTVPDLPTALPLTGGQSAGPDHAWDDRLWAAAELAILTGDVPFIEESRTLMRLASVQAPSQQTPSFLGLTALFKAPGSSAEDRGAIGQALARRGEELLAQAARSPFGLAAAPGNPLVNSQIALTGLLLMGAHDATGDSRFRETAADHLHYLLGRNAYGQSFVSGVGTSAVSPLSHPMAAASGIAPRGWLLDPSGPYGWLAHPDTVQSDSMLSVTLSGSAAMAALLARLMAARDKPVSAGPAG